MKLVLTILGVIIASIGGVIAYRAFFLEPSAAIVITSSEVREVPNYSRIALGTVLLVGGAILAVASAIRRVR